MIPNSDLQRWQQAIDGIAAAQSTLSPKELSAFQALAAYINSGDFEAVESDGYIRVMKGALQQHGKNRLLKAHLTNFVMLCEKYFKKKAAVQPAPAPAIIPPAFEPPTFKPPVEDPIEPQLQTPIAPPQVTPPLFEQPSVETVAPSKPKIENPVVTPPQQQQNRSTNNTVQKTDNPRKGNNTVAIMIGLIIILILGYYIVKDSDWFNNPVSEEENRQIESTVNTEQMEQEIAVTKIRAVEQQVIIDSLENLIVTLRKNQISAQQQVRDPSAVISATKMNALYIGVDNPIAATIFGVPSSSVQFSVSNGTFTKVGNEYMVKPATVGNASIRVWATVEGKTIDNKMDFRVRMLPSPTAKVGGKSGGNIDRNTLAGQQGILTDMGDFLFDLRFVVTEFSMVIMRRDGERNSRSTSAKFTDEQKALINTLQKGERVLFTGIKAQLADSNHLPVDLAEFSLVIN